MGKKLIDAAPHEPAVGNIVRRVLAIIREEEEDDQKGDYSAPVSEPESDNVTPLDHPQSKSVSHALPNGFFNRADTTMGSSPSPSRAGGASRPPLMTSHTGVPGGTRPGVTSMFSILAHPTMRLGGVESPGRSGTSTPQIGSSGILQNLRPEVIKGIKEIIDEINEADDEICGAALEQIHPQETIFTYSSSLTVQRFLLKAASKRKFSVIHAESYPNNHLKTHALLTGKQDSSSSTDAPDEEDENLPSDSFSKTLTSAGITVIMIPDSSIFALMPRASKVILDTHAVLTNGSIVAAAGTKAVIKAAKFHRVPVVALAATYKLSPLYPYDPYSLIAYGDAGKVVPFQDAELRQGLVSGVRNPLYDFVDAGDVDLFVTNQVPAVVSSGYLYRVVRDQYRDEDLEL